MMAKKTFFEHYFTAIVYQCKASIRQFFRHRRIAFGLGISFLIVPCLAVFLGLVGFLFEESGSLLRVTWSPLVIIFILLLSALLILGGVGISFLREDRRAAPLIPYLQGMDEKDYEVIERMLHEGRPAVPLIRLYLEGMDKGDYEVIERILHKEEYKEEVELYPLQGGFSTAMLFEVNCPGRLSTVLKLGPRDKIETEEERYNKFVRNRLVTTPLIRTEYDEQGRGALLYPYAALLQGRSVTFEELYKEASDTRKVTKIIERLFDSRLNKWFEGTSPSNRHYLYRKYNLDEREWDRIKEALKGLGFDPDAQSFPELNLGYNPLKVAQGLFENRQDRKFSTKLAVVHGDLNGRNILIDSNDNVCLIDFAKTGKDHCLRDFCRLEVEIKYVLTELSHDEDVQYAVDLDRELLLDHNSQQFSTLEELLIINPQLDGLVPRFDRMLRSIKALRQRAARVIGLDINQPPEEYYIGLLHYTLDALRYQQCDNLSKRFALQAVAILCQALNPADNQSRVH